MNAVNVVKSLWGYLTLLAIIITVEETPRKAAM